MKVIDNAINESYQDFIESLFGGIDMPWYYNPSISRSDPEAGDTNEGFAQVTYDILNNRFKTPFSDITMPILLEGVYKHNKYKVRIEDIIRIRVGMFLKNQSPGDHLPHVDYKFPHTTLLYYVNDSDGPTKIYNDQRRVIKEVKPKKGRVLIFDGNYYHSSSGPVKSARRIAINFNFLMNQPIPSGEYR